MNIFLPCLYSLLGCIGFCLVYNIRGKMLILATLGGVLGWFTFLMCGSMQNVMIQSFIAMMVIAIYSEIMARVHKMPVTVFLIVSLIPLVPGSNIYYTMEYCINGQIIEFLKSALETIAISGALALAILLVSSLTRFFTSIIKHFKHFHL